MKYVEKTVVKTKNHHVKLDGFLFLYLGIKVKVRKILDNDSNLQVSTLIDI
jgi:hypothetical protein